MSIMTFSTILPNNGSSIIGRRPIVSQFAPSKINDINDGTNVTNEFFILNCATAL